MTAPSLPSPSSTPDELIAFWLATDGEKERPPATQRAYRRAMDLWLAYLSKQLPARAHLGSSLLWLADIELALQWQTEMKRSGMHPGTLNQKISAVSSFYRQMLSLSLAPPHFGEDPFHNRVLVASSGSYEKVRILTVPEYQRLLRWLEEHANRLDHLRSHALIRTLLHTGWRATELLAMRAGDLRPSPTTPGALRYHCKLPGGRGFVDQLPPDCVIVLESYLCMDGRPLATLADDDLIWTAVKRVNMKGLRVEQDMNKAITVRSLSRTVRTHLRLAGIRGYQSVTLHDLRHTYAYLLHEGGAVGTYISRRMRFQSDYAASRFLRTALGEGVLDDQSVYLNKHRLQTGNPSEQTNNVDGDGRNRNEGR